MPPLGCVILGIPDCGLWVLVWASRRVCACIRLCACMQGGAEGSGTGLLFCLPSGHLGGLRAMLMAFSLLLTVKKKCSAGLKLSNLMNLGRKKSTSLEPVDRSLETSSKNRSPAPAPQQQRAHPWAEPISRKAALLAQAEKLGLALNKSPGMANVSLPFLFTFSAGRLLRITSLDLAAVLGPLRK